MCHFFAERLVPIPPLRSVRFYRHLIIGSFGYNMKAAPLSKETVSDSSSSSESEEESTSSEELEQKQKKSKEPVGSTEESTEETSDSSSEDESSEEQTSPPPPPSTKKRVTIQEGYAIFLHEKPPILMCSLI